jgi:hypothetical protein
MGVFDGLSTSYLTLCQQNLKKSAPPKFEQKGTNSSKKTCLASKLSAFSFITPLFGVIGGYFIMHDTLTPASRLRPCW